MQYSEQQIELTDDNFQSEIQRSALPVLVEFWADWSGGCHIMAPILESLAQSFTGRLKLLQLNVEQCPRTAKQFGVRTIPTLLLFRSGELVESVSGTLPRSELVKLVERHLPETADTTHGTPKTDSH